MSSPDSIPPSIPPESPPSLPPSPPKDRITISIDSTGSNAENPETVLQPSSTVEKNSAIMKRIGRFMAGMLSPGKSIENEYFQQGHDLTIPVRLGRSSSCDLSSRYSIADPNSASMSKTTLSENTMISKISRKLKDIMQNSDQSDSGELIRFKPTINDLTVVGLHASATSIALSSTASTDFCAGINNEDEDNSVLDCLSVETGSRQVWLFERTRRSKPFFIRVRPMQSVREIIKIALETVRNNDETYVDPSTWHICKIDPNQLLTLVWFDPHASAAECKINDGVLWFFVIICVTTITKDELMIKNEDEEETFQYRIPALKITGVSTFRFGVTVRQALDKILAETNIEPISYGVYHKKIGLWLDEKRDLMSYDIIDVSKEYSCTKLA
jgi:hypothetical protein